MKSIAGMLEHRRWGHPPSLSLWHWHRVSHTLVVAPDGTVRFFQEELPITRWRVENVALGIKAEGVYLDIKASALEVEDRDILGLEAGLAVADIHADAVEEVVAVGFDDQLFAIGRQAAEEGGEGSLGARVEVDLGLLPEGELRCIGTEQFRDYREDLTDTVADIDQIAPRAFASLATFSDLKLERRIRTLAESVDSDLIEKA